MGYWLTGLVNAFTSFSMMSLFIKEAYRQVVTINFIAFVLYMSLSLFSNISPYFIATAVFVSAIYSNLMAMYLDRRI